MNFHRQIAVPRVPAVGNRYDLELSAEPGYGSSSHAAAAAISSGRAGTPVVLPGFGTLLLDPMQLLPLPPVSVPWPGGRTTI